MVGRFRAIGGLRGIVGLRGIGGLRDVFGYGFGSLVCPWASIKSVSSLGWVRVDRGTLVSYISNKSSIVISMVGHNLLPAVRKVNLI